MKFIYLFLVAVMLSACGSYKTTVQSEDVTYLQLSGDTKGRQLSLDGNTPIDLAATKSYDENGKRVTKIQLKPGTHRVTITQNAQLEIDRQIYVSEGNAFEIVLP